MSLSQRTHLLMFSFLAGVALCFASCAKNTDDAPRPPSDNTPAATLVQVLDYQFISVDELASAIANSPAYTLYTSQMGPDQSVTQFIANTAQVFVKTHLSRCDSLFDASAGRDAQGRRRWGIASHTFSYITIDVNGHPILLSGRVSFPKSTIDSLPHTLHSFSLFHHQVLFSSECAPSHAISAMILRTLWNSAVIEPDYQGVGIDYHCHPENSMSMHVTSRQMADCIKAAVEIMSQHHVSLAPDGFTTNWGQSLGCPPAISYAYYYDHRAPQSERDLLRLHSTFAGEGPTDPYMTLLYGIDHPEIDLSYGQYFQYMVSFGEKAISNYTFADFAPEWMFTTLVPHGDTATTYLQAMVNGSLTIEDIIRFQPEGYDRFSPAWSFSPDMLTPEGHIDANSPKTKAMLQLFKENSVPQDWSPSVNLYLSHAVPDEFMPYVPARRFYENLHAASPNHVFWLEAPATSNALSPIAGFHIAMSVLSLAYMSAAEFPADMAQFYPLTD